MTVEMEGKALHTACLQMHRGHWFQKVTTFVLPHLKQNLILFAFVETIKQTKALFSYNKIEGVESFQLFLHAFFSLLFMYYTVHLD